MNIYQKLTAREIRALFPFFQASCFECCDYTAGCAFLWSDYFDYSYRVSDGFLIIRGNANGVPFYLAPFGAGDPAPIFTELLKEAAEAGAPLIFGAVPRDYVLKILRFAPDANVETNRDWYDYVYSAEDLRLLSGKKFHGQKNHFNAFVKSYSHQFRAMDAQNASEIKRFFESMELTKNDRESDLKYEKAHVLKLFDSFEELGQLGGALYVDGAPVAFSFGEIVGDTLVVHVEKADRAFRGAYVAIMRSFVDYALTINPEIEFINREDDMGMEGLRKAKTDLHPLKLIEKFNVVVPTK